MTDATKNKQAYVIIIIINNQRLLIPPMHEAQMATIDGKEGLKQV